MIPLFWPQVEQETEELVDLHENVGSFRGGPPGYSGVPVLDDHLELRNPINGLDFNKYHTLKEY